MDMNLPPDPNALNNMALDNSPITKDTMYEPHTMDHDPDTPTTLEYSVPGHDLTATLPTMT